MSGNLTPERIRATERDAMTTDQKCERKGCDRTAVAVVESHRDLRVSRRCEKHIGEMWVLRFIER